MDLTKYTCQQLKECLQALKERTSGNKGELMVRLGSHDEETVKGLLAKVSKSNRNVATEHLLDVSMNESADDSVSNLKGEINALKGTVKEGFLHPIDKADEPLHTFHIDHVGPMEQTKKQYNYILTIVDAFSKFTWIFPTKSTTAEEVIDRFTKVAAVFGNPERIITDRGTAFTANSFKEYCQENNITQHLMTTGVPRGNGQVERIHKIIISLISKLSIDNKQSWYKHTDKVMQFINNIPSRSTKISPFTLMTGLKMKIKENVEFKNLIEKELIQELQDNREEARAIAKENIGKIQAENKKYYDSKRKIETDYKVNDLVAIKRTQFGTGLKLKPKYLGPYKIIRKKSCGRYDVEKVGENEGPIKTSTTTEFMKKWPDSGRI